MKLLIGIATLFLACCSLATATAADAETVVAGLTNPCGVAVQPETGTVFVADSGAGRVVRIVEGKAQDVIVGFPKDVYGKGPKFDIGPLGLLFLDKSTLVVGGGGLPDGEELLRVYNVPEAGAAAIKADDMVSSAKLAPNDEVKGEGNFYALAKTDTAIFVTANGDDTKGWVGMAPLDGNKVGEFKRFIATKEATEVDAPVGITVSPAGEVVVGQMGEITVPGDGLLTFYGTDGKMLLNLQTGLSDITAVAYGKKGQLYALDFAWPGKSEAGLYQLLAVRKEGKQAVETRKLLDLDRPTAMAFADDGTLYITVIGTAAEGEEGPTGKLLKVAPGL